MDTKTAIELAGGQALVARACTKNGYNVTRFTVHQWYHKNRLPSSEWTGDTSYARIISRLADVFAVKISPLEICPGAGQYMQQQNKEAA